jgi:hypothetical protein
MSKNGTLQQCRRNPKEKMIKLLTPDDEKSLKNETLLS